MMMMLMMIAMMMIVNDSRLLLVAACCVDEKLKCCNVGRSLADLAFCDFLSTALGCCLLECRYGMPLADCYNN